MNSKTIILERDKELNYDGNADPHPTCQQENEDLTSESESVSGVPVMRVNNPILVEKLNTGAESGLIHKATSLSAPSAIKKVKDDIIQDIDDFLMELNLSDSTAINVNKELEASEASKIEDMPIFLLTSLAGGGIHMPSRTNNLANILTANNIKFIYRDCGTDGEARGWWKRQSKGRELPGVVVGNHVVGNWREIVVANEEWSVSKILGLS